MLPAAVLCWGITVTPGTYAEDGSGGEIDVAAYTGMRRLRKAVDLSNETLAAMGCSESNAVEVLEALLGWHQTNSTAIEANRKAKIKAAKDLRLALRKVGMGPRDETLLGKIPSLKAALAAAVKQRSDLLKTAVGAAESKLSAAGKGVWATVRRNAALPSKYRYAPSLTEAQIKALHLANRTCARRLAAAKDSAGRTAAASQLAAAEDSTLSAVQKTAITAARTNITQNMPAAVKATETVMPIPAALKEIEPGPNDLLSPPENQ